MTPSVRVPTRPRNSHLAAPLSLTNTWPSAVPRNSVPPEFDPSEITSPPSGPRRSQVWAGAFPVRAASKNIQRCSLRRKSYFSSRVTTKNRAPRVIPESPTVILVRVSSRATSNSRRSRFLVSRAFGYKHEVNATVFLLLALFRRRFANAGADAGCIDALFAQVLLGKFGTLLR
jgi:hypothetical protein